MIKSPAYLIFYLSLIFGTIVTISSSSWLSAWMGMEINLLSFIPIMNNNTQLNIHSTEASLKYFLIQAIASITMLFSMILTMMKINMLSLNMNNFFQFKSMILLSLMMKSGAAPLHFWFPSIVESMSWMNMMIIISWQKLAPLVMMNLMLINWMFYVSILLSSVISVISTLNMTSLRKIMAFSSINHLSWMMLSMLSSETLFFTYFVFYSILSITLMIKFKTMNIFYLNQMFNTFNNKWMNFYFTMNVLSLSGLPPLMGFIPKMLVINLALYNSHIMLSFFLIIFTLIMLFTYLQISFSSLIMNFWTNNLYFMFNMTKMNQSMKINYLLYSNLTINSLLILFIMTYSMIKT